MNTHWTSPKRNIFAGMLALRTALAAGMNARLIRLRNEDCDYPIRVKNANTDFKAYEFQVGHASSKAVILNRTDMSGFEKFLSLNYVTRYGTKEAKDRYYSTGVLGPDNDEGVGTSHLIQIDDYIKYLEETDDQRYNMFKRQYRALGCYDDAQHFYDFFKLKKNDSWTTMKFKRKLWVVELLKADERIKPGWLMFTSLGLLNAFSYPLKFIPKRSVLKMAEYTVITYRVGSITHGRSVQFQVPKKFSFN